MTLTEEEIRKIMKLASEETDAHECSDYEDYSIILCNKTSALCDKKWKESLPKLLAEFELFLSEEDNMYDSNDKLVYPDFKFNDSEKEAILKDYKKKATQFLKQKGLI